jgi:hypothetical protein
MEKNFFYRTNNLINGKFYYGSHCGDDVRYCGSGKLLKRAINKYGRNNFELIILKRFKTREEAYCFEERFLKLYKISSLQNSYNVKDSALGGDTFSNNPNKESIRNKMIDIAKTRMIEPNERAKCNIFKDVSESRLLYLKQIRSNASRGRLNGRAKKIIANEKLYHTLDEAALDLNLTRSQVKYRLKKKIFNYA